MESSSGCKIASSTVKCFLFGLTELPVSDPLQREHGRRSPAYSPSGLTWELFGGRLLTVVAKLFPQASVVEEGSQRNRFFKGEIRIALLCRGRAIACVRMLSS